jgi:hypothetical protein
MRGRPLALAMLALSCRDRTGRRCGHRLNVPPRQRPVWLRGDTRKVRGVAALCPCFVVLLPLIFFMDGVAVVVCGNDFLEVG